MSNNINKYSARITQPPSQGASQAMLYATGLREEDMNKPQVGIASVWYEGNPCNMHLLLSGREGEGRRAGGGLVGMRFNTIGVSDGISMGTDGMSFSLQSRDLIADSIETVMGAQWYDANISIPGCDKNMPGCLMAMGRLNRPSLMVYGGTIRAGCRCAAKKLDVISAFQSYGEYIAGKIDRERSDRESCGTHVPARARAAACTRRTRWRRRSKRSACRCPTARRRPPKIRESCDECMRAGAAIATLLELRPEAARHHDARSFRERDGAR